VKLIEIVKKVESGLVSVLLVMTMAVLCLATLDLGWHIVKDVLTPPILILDVEELLRIFGMVLLVLIGVELLETVCGFHEERVVRVETVLLVAMIAVARKLIVTDRAQLSSYSLMDVAAIIIALAGAYYLLKRAENLK
jgi:uncharacterized membrane protein (DUF373 family)